MTYSPDQNTPATVVPAQRPASGMQLPLPLSKPLVTYVFLGIIGVVYLLEMVLGGSTNNATLVRMGAQLNSLVAAGQGWRLVTAMFLHIGIAHVLFNAWALFSLGQDIERFYGRIRFTAIVLLSGLFGNVLYFMFGPDVLSAGFSGAVFGLIGAEVAFWLRNKEMFGKFGRQRLGNLALLIGINLLFGFTAQGINNLAHIGGLVSGFLLGLGMAPHYKVAWSPAYALPAAGAAQPVYLVDGAPQTPQWVDGTALWKQAASVGLAALLLLGGYAYGNARWDGSASVWQQADTALRAGNLEQAELILLGALRRSPRDLDALYNLAQIKLRQGKVAEAAGYLESANRVEPRSPDIQFALGLSYLELGRKTDGRPLLEAFLEQEPSGERADIARDALAR